MLPSEGGRVCAHRLIPPPNGTSGEVGAGDRLDLTGECDFRHVAEDSLLLRSRVRQICPGDSCAATGHLCHQGSAFTCGRSRSRSG